MANTWFEPCNRVVHEEQHRGKRSLKQPRGEHSGKIHSDVQLSAFKSDLGQRSNSNHLSRHGERQGAAGLTELQNDSPRVVNPATDGSQAYVRAPCRLTVPSQMHKFGQGGFEGATAYYQQRTSLGGC